MAMLDPASPIAKLLQKDRRYAFEAYVFVFEALRYAQEVMGLGIETEENELPSKGKGKRPAPKPRHLTGQELCEAIRRYALEQYGFMAKCVLNQWGVKSTGDFGEIVFNLIEVDAMHKTEQDRKEDFYNVFDFDEGLTKQFKIHLPE